jgi:hypothetical protein
MQNNFEKQVQQKMEELSFSPSAPVWQRVEEAIKKKKDRRRALLWLPLLFLLLGGSIWLLVNQKKTNEIANVNHSSPQNHQSPTVKQKQSQAPHQVQAQEINTTDNKTSVPKENFRSSKNLVAFIGKEKTKAIKTKIVNDNIENNKQIIAKAEIERTESKPVTAESIPKTDLATKTEDIKKSETETVSKEVMTPNTDSSKKEQKQGKSKDWLWGVSAFAGQSGISNTVTQLNNASNFGPSGTAAPPNAVTTSSSIKNAFSFSIGLIAKKQLSEKFSFTTGIHYSLYRHVVTVGNKIQHDTVIYTSSGNVAASNYFPNERTNDYKNNFHFISIPLAVNYKPFKNVPLTFDAGISLQQLINTNALLFSSNANLYYQDKNAFNKTQFFGSFGVNYKIIESKKFSLIAGPAINYGLTNLYKHESGHLFSFGLNTQILFSK